MTRAIAGNTGNGSWAPFKPGNKAGVKHGGYTAAFTEPVAETIAEGVLSQPDCAYLRAGAYELAVRGWAMAEAQLLLFETWMLGLPEAERYTARGAQSPPIDTWGRLSRHAAGLRKPLGLDPVSRTKIGQSLAAQQLDLARLAAEMHKMDAA